MNGTYPSDNTHRAGPGEKFRKTPPRRTPPQHRAARPRTASSSARRDPGFGADCQSATTVVPATVVSEITSASIASRSSPSLRPSIVRSSRPTAPLAVGHLGRSPAIWVQSAGPDGAGWLTDAVAVSVFLLQSLAKLVLTRPARASARARPRWAPGQSQHRSQRRGHQRPPLSGTTAPSTRQGLARRARPARPPSCNR